MSTYSIKELGDISGIKPHTIRIWEQRYGLLSPARTGTNIRYYSDEHLKKLLNVCELLKSGMKISRICELTDAQVSAEMAIVIANSFRHEMQYDAIISQALIAAITYDEVLFDKTFANSILRFGLVKTYINVIYPLLVRVGLMWGKGDVIPAQEHFFSNLIKQKLFASIDSLPLSNHDTNETWVLFLPENEEHEIGLLFANYILRQHGRKVIYLGSKVPYDNMARVVAQCKASHLYTFFISNQPIDQVNLLLDRMAKDHHSSRILVSGNKNLLNEVVINKQVEWIKDIDTLIKMMNEVNV